MGAEQNCRDLGDRWRGRGMEKRINDLQLSPPVEFPRSHMGPVDPATLFFGTQRDGSCLLDQTSRSYLYCLSSLGLFRHILAVCPLFFLFLSPQSSYAWDSVAIAWVLPQALICPPQTQPCPLLVILLQNSRSRDHGPEFESGRYCFSLLAVLFGAYRGFPARVGSLH